MSLHGINVVEADFTALKADAIGRRAFIFYSYSVGDFSIYQREYELRNELAGQN